MSEKQKSNSSKLLDFVIFYPLGFFLFSIYYLIKLLVFIPRFIFRIALAQFCIWFLAATLMLKSEFKKGLMLFIQSPFLILSKWKALYSFPLKLISPKNVNIILEHQDPLAFECAVHKIDLMIRYSEYELYGKKHFYIRFDDIDPLVVISALEMIYSQDSYLQKFIETLKLVNDKNFLTSKNCDAIIRLDHYNMEGIDLCSLIKTLSKDDLLTEERFNLLITYLTMFRAVSNQVWGSLSKMKLSEENWNGIFAICRQVDPSRKDLFPAFGQHVENYIRKNILGETLKPERVSIDEHGDCSEISIGLTARLLYEQYLKNQTFDASIHWEALKSSLNDKAEKPFKAGALDTKQREMLHKTQVAIRALNILETKAKEFSIRISSIFLEKNKALIDRKALNFDALDFTLPDYFRLSVYDFIAAIYYEAQQQKGFSEEVILEAFIDVLHEVLRGNNINEEGVDDEQKKDDMSCLSNVPRRLCERLKGLAPSAQYFFVNKHTLHLNLKILFIEKVLIHGESLLEKAKQGDLDAKKALADMKRQLIEKDYEYGKDVDYIDCLIKDESFKKDFRQVAVLENNTFSIFNTKGELLIQINNFLEHSVPALGQIDFYQQDNYGASITVLDQSQKGRFKKLFDEYDKLPDTQDNDSDATKEETIKLMRKLPGFFEGQSGAQVGMADISCPANV